MSTAVSEIWTVSRDWGYEGKSEPESAFLTEGQASEYARHLGRGEATYVVTKVPLMRFVPAVIEPAVLSPIMAIAQSAQEQGAVP
jgi:hypothetical protein